MSIAAQKITTDKISFPVVAITPFTTLDWPGRMCATFFVAGCPWNCEHCHNKSLRHTTTLYDWDSITDFLHKRRGKLDGIVLSGGEPTLYPSLGKAIRKIKDEGFEVALHTGGAFPERLQELLAHTPPDWVGMDYKAPLASYSDITRDPLSSHNILWSIRILIKSGVDYEIRTTIFPEITSLDIVMQMARELSSFGVKNWMLQQCRLGKLQGGFDYTPPSTTLRRWAEKVFQYTGVKCGVRAGE